MPDQNRGTLEAIGIELVQVFQPIQQRLDDGQIVLLLAELGVTFPPELASDPDFSPAITTLVSNIRVMPTLVGDIIAQLSLPSPDFSIVAEKSAQLVEKIVQSVEKFIDIKDAIEAYLATNPITDVGGQLAAFLGEFATRLFDYLFIQYLDSKSTMLVAALEFFGIVERSVQNQGSTDAIFPEYVLHKLHLDNVAEFFSNPKALLETLYGWGTPGFTGHSLLEKLYKLALGLGLPAVYTPATPELDILFLKITPDLTLTPPGLTLLVSDTIAASTGINFGDTNWKLSTVVGAEIAASAGLTIIPGGEVRIIPPAGTLDGDFTVRFQVPGDGGPDTPYILIGQAGASRFEFKQFYIEAGAGLTWEATPLPGKATGRWHVEGALEDGKIVIKPGDPDGFLAKILPPDGFTIDFSLLLGYSSEKGFYFRGSGTLEFDFPTNISIGPIAILNLTLGISFGEAIGISMGVDIKAELGPFAVIVENMGIKANFTFPPNNSGNLGFTNVGIEFKPPRGIGMTLDAGAVKGGGYLMFDFENGRYAGALELDFSGLFGFTAIGIITTKFPDGSEGFSLLLLINVTFGTPISLGYNFYLAGVGGLIGLHRTMSTEAIRNGVRDGSIANILFPENPIANITRIISDLEAIFPIKKDQFFLGVMARITWNTPAILTVEAGLAIEFPNPVKIAILGVIRCILPDPDSAILRLNVAFAGIIDFEKKLLSFDASIFDSKILTITLEGDMALRVSWGDKPDFLVSVGGFHPSFTPAPHLELAPMRRMTVNVLSGNPNLVLTAYFAITTNTIQFGAAIDFSFRIAGFGVYGHLGFDVLIQFSPFRFIASISASVEIKLGSSTLFAISLEFNLEGPSPWRAYGHGSFKILFIKIKVSFDKTWGEAKENSLPSTEVLPLLMTELNKDSNWAAKPSSQLAELVTLSAVASDPDTVLVRPFGSMEVNQNVLPLDMTVQRFGNYKPLDISKATISKLTVNGHEYLDAELTDLKDSFAPNAFKEMSDADKLSAPSYEKQNSGVKLTTTDAIEFDYSINRVVEYECIISDYEEVELGILSVNMSFFKGFIKGGAVGKSELSKLKKRAAETSDKFVELGEEKFAVADLGTMKNAHGDGLVFDSKSEADEFLRSVVASDPSKKGKLQLTPAFQLA
jgi:hypothetical protein